MDPSRVGFVRALAVVMAVGCGGLDDPGGDVSGGDAPTVAPADATAFDRADRGRDVPADDASDAPDVPDASTVDVPLADVHGDGATSCTTNAECGRAHYCEHPRGICGARGLCAPRPTEAECLRIFDVRTPLCGCDGVTYDDFCFIAAAGVSLAATGECSARDGGAPGGCRTNADCTAVDTYCARPAGVCDTAPGSCATRPTFCPAISLPVCSCEGTTLSNPCAAASRGVNVRAVGRCP
jgi:hypothetical protein